MTKKILAFIIRSLPYKTESSRLALTHAISSQTVEIHLKDGDSVEAVVCFIGDGVLNCRKNQEAMKHYGNISIGTHLTNALLLDLKVLICKEDVESFGLKEDILIMDAEHLGGETKAQIVPYSEIQKALESADHLQVF